MNPTHSSARQMELPLPMVEIPPVTKPQHLRIMNELKAGKKLTGLDAPRLFIAGSAFAKRMQELWKIHKINIKFEKIKVGDSIMTQYSLPTKKD